MKDINLDILRLLQGDSRKVYPLLDDVLTNPGQLERWIKLLREVNKISNTFTKEMIEKIKNENTEFNSANTEEIFKALHSSKDLTISNDVFESIRFNGVVASIRNKKVKNEDLSKLFRNADCLEQLDIRLWADDDSFLNRQKRKLPWWLLILCCIISFVLGCLVVYWIDHWVAKRVQSTEPSRVIPPSTTQLTQDSNVHSSIEDMAYKGESHTLSSEYKRYVYNINSGIIIGLNDYKDMTGLSTGYADTDAQTLYLVLKKQGLSPDCISLLKGSDATVGSIRYAIGPFLEKTSTSSGVTLIFFSGHGIRGKSGTYLTAVDSLSNDLETTAINFGELVKTLERYGKGKILIVIDACHSGGIGISSAELSSSENIAVFVSSRETENSHEDEKIRSGVFTYYLLQGLTGIADKNNDGKIELQELYEYVSKKVMDCTQDKQHPELVCSSLMKNIVISAKSKISQNHFEEVKKANVTILCNVMGANVWLKTAPSNEFCLGSIKEAGGLRICGLSPGDYEFTVRAERASPEIRQIKITAGSNWPVSIKLQQDSLTNLCIFDARDDKESCDTKNFWRPIVIKPNPNSVLVDTECEELIPYKGKKCIKMSFSSKEKWGTVYFQSGELNTQGADVYKLLRLQGTEKIKITFFARGDIGGEVVKFGGMQSSLPLQQVTLSSLDWLKYELSVIDLEKLKNVIAPFCVIFPEGSKDSVIFLDHITFEKFQ